MQETEKIWMNGELVDWADARVHVGAHGLHYGTGVFEGIRCYDTERGPAVFRLQEHLDRLQFSMRVMRMDHDLTNQRLTEAVLEVIRANEFREDIHLRPFAWVDGEGDMLEVELRKLAGAQ